MATKMKAESAQAKPRRGVSPSDQTKRVVRKASPSGGIRETSPSTSSSSQRPVPNYLKPTASSRTETSKTVKKAGPETAASKSSTPLLNRRRSFDRPPPASHQMQKVLSSGPRERSVAIKSPSPPPKSAFAKTTLEAKTSKPKAVTSRGTAVSRTPARKSAPTDQTVSKRESSESGSNTAGHEVNDVLTEAQVEDKAQPVKEVEVDQCDQETDQEAGQVDVATTQQPEQPELTIEPNEDIAGKSVARESCQDDILLEHNQDASSVAEDGDDKVQKEELLEENIDPKGKIIDNVEEHHERGGDDDNTQDEAESSTGEIGVTEAEEKPQDQSEEHKEVVVPEAKDVVDVDGETSMKQISSAPEVGEENVETNNKSNEEEQQEAAKADTNAGAAALKNQKSMGKKDAPVYNDVIEETASKLLEKRKNKVRALVGAFETVISLQEPDA